MVAQLLGDTDYRRAADATVPERFRLSSCETLPTCIQVDFGLVRKEDGTVEGRLVELQAFPSLYEFHMALAEAWHQALGPNGTRHIFLGGLDAQSYVALMRDVLVGRHDPDHVVLMEIAPQQQKTRPDFHVTEQTWGIRAVDTMEVIRDGRRLFYRRDSRLTPIARIYKQGPRLGRRVGGHARRLISAAPAPHVRSGRRIPRRCPERPGGQPLRVRGPGCPGRAGTIDRVTRKSSSPRSRAGRG
jgi:hypothetical protein